MTVLPPRRGRYHVAMKRCLLLPVLAVVFGLTSLLIADAPPAPQETAAMAHTLVREWVGKGQVPADGQYFGAEAQAPGVFAVKVTLRDHGVRVGAGEATLDTVPAPEAGDLMRLVERATQRAIDDAKANFQQRKSRAIVQGADPEKVNAQTWDEVGFQLTVELQIAYGLADVNLLKSDPPAAALDRFLPGYQGLWVRADATRAPTLIWPGDAIAGGLSTKNYVTEALAGQKLPLEQVTRLGRPAEQGGIEMKTFRVMHSADGLAGMPPVFLDSGLTPEPVEQVTVQRVREATQALAEHLARRLVVAHGTYRPSNDAYEKVDSASMLQQHLLACYALMQYGMRRPDDFMRLASAPQAEASGGSGGGDNWVQQTVTRFDAVLSAWNDNPKQFDTASRALLLLCLIDWPMQHPKFEQWRRDLAADLWAKIDQDGSLKPGDDPQANNQATSLTLQALVANALARQYMKDPAHRVEPVRLGTLLDYVFTQLIKRPGLGALCWYTQAQDAAGPTIAQQLNREVWQTSRRAALVQLFNQLLTRQIRTPAPAPGSHSPGSSFTNASGGASEKDSISGGGISGGGISGGGGPAYALGALNFRPATMAGPPVVNWETAYVLLAVSDMIATTPVQGMDPATRKTVDEQLLAAQFAARFLIQLQFDLAEAYYVRNLDETLGGIRLTASDNRLSIGPNAITLLAMSRILDAIRQAERMPAAPGG